MKNRIFISTTFFLLTVLCGLSFARATSVPREDSRGILTIGAIHGAWSHDWEAARDLAKKEKRYLFADFTGSDWCGWCMHMDEQVFKKEAWKKYSEKLVLAYIDFPRDQKLVPKNFKKQNERLNNEFHIEGFPTYILFAPTGEELARFGAARDVTPQKFIADIESAILKHLLTTLSPAEKEQLSVANPTFDFPAFQKRSEDTNKTFDADAEKLVSEARSAYKKYLQYRKNQLKDADRKTLADADKKFGEEMKALEDKMNEISKKKEAFTQQSLEELRTYLKPVLDARSAAEAKK